jgi:hypothetical protein
VALLGSVAGLNGFTLRIAMHRAPLRWTQTALVHRRCLVELTLERYRQLLRVNRSRLRSRLRNQLTVYDWPPLVGTIG